MTTARRRQPKTQLDDGNSDVTDYKPELWRMADALRGSMDAAEYKHVVLGLIFLKYISDAFEEAHAQLEAERDQGADPEHPDEYRAQSIFWVPPEARWPKLQSQARQPAIGRAVDDAMTAIERDNPALKDVLPKDYARPALDKTRLGQVVDLVSNIKVGGAEARATDVLSPEDIARVADTYHAWRGRDGGGEYADVPGFCKSATLEEVRKHGHVLTPGRYVGAEPQQDDGEPFEEKMARLTAQWREQQAEAQRLDAAIAANLARLGFGADAQEDV